LIPFVFFLRGSTTNHFRAISRASCP
jgi:hypothetical protein